MTEPTVISLLSCHFITLPRFRWEQHLVPFPGPYYWRRLPGHGRAGSCSGRRRFHRYIRTIERSRRISHPARRTLAKWRPDYWWWSLWGSGGRVYSRAAAGWGAKWSTGFAMLRVGNYSASATDLPRTKLHSDRLNKNGQK